jgi:hypothetical protein
MSLFDVFDEHNLNEKGSDGFSMEALNYMIAFEKKSVLSSLESLEGNELFTYFTKGLNTHEVMVKLVEIAGPCRMVIANYSLTEFPARILSQLKGTGAIKHLTMLLDRTVYRTPKMRAFAESIADEIAFDDNHAKVILIESEKRKWIFLSSSNLTKNHRWEFGVVLWNQAKHDFFKEKINTIINEISAQRN